MTRKTLPVQWGYKLTTDHASSSYGIPVLVDDFGNAYGPGDNLSSRGPASDFASAHPLNCGDFIRRWADCCDWLSDDDRAFARLFASAQPA